MLKLPVVLRGREAIGLYWTNAHETIKDFTPEFVRREAGKMMEMVIRVATSENPLMANREQLTSWTIEYAQYQVLVMDASPAADPTGLRGIYGISGELKARLVDVAEKYQSIKEFMHGFPEVKTWDDVWNPVLMRYRITHAWAHVFQLMRYDLGDYNSERDWFRPYIAAMAGWSEHQIRQEIGLPSLLDKDAFDANMKSLLLSAFMNRVMEGGRYPDLKWIENLKGMDRPEWYEYLKPVY